MLLGSLPVVDADNCRSRREPDELESGLTEPRPKLQYDLHGGAQVPPKKAEVLVGILPFHARPDPRPHCRPGKCRG